MRHGMSETAKNPYPKGRAAVFRAIGADKFVDRVKHLETGIAAYRALVETLRDGTEHVADQMQKDSVQLAVGDWEKSESIEQKGCALWRMREDHVVRGESHAGDYAGDDHVE